MAAAEDTVQGLKRLTNLATVDIIQTSAGLKGCNYTVLGEEEVLFNLIEDCSTHGILTSGNRREFLIDGVDSTGRKVFSLRRPGATFADKIELYMDNNLLSIVRLKSTFINPVIKINDAQDCLTLRLKGTFFDNGCNFQLQTKTKNVIGSVHKINRGLREVMSGHKDDYVITFPADLATNFKLAVIMATVLIDIRFHEFK